MLDDPALLQRFAATRAEDDFTELVQRHLNLVYSAALRQVGGDHQFAEEVAQSVFTDLARKAKSLTNHSSLAGWLYTSAHFAAAKIIRGEQRRRVREQEAHQMHETHANTPPELDWERLQPVIDGAMHELPEADREVILQRYFERKPFVQIGARLGLTENAARMRAERALDKLRGILATRGVSSTTATLATVLTVQAVLVAPKALAAAVVSASLTATVATGVAVGGGLLTAAKLKVLIPSACAVALLVGVILQQQTLNRLREENAALRRARQAMVVETSAVTQTGETDELKREKLELLRLRGETGRLRRDLAEQRLLVANRQVTNEIPATEKLQNTFQVHIFARFYSGGDPALETFPIDSTAVVAPTEMSKLLKHLTEATESAELLSAMQVTTRSGQQAQIQATDVQTNQLTGAVFQSGHIVDVLPRVSDDGRSVALTVIANKLKNCPVLKDEISNAQPVLEVGAAAMEMAANVSLWGGQTIAIAKRFEDKKVVLFVTPTLIDPAGNRVHPDTEP